ncbi:MAG: universal stress protein [Thermodesulfobacteriota bacterium]
MKPGIKKILYVTDLSENSAFAYLYATDLAANHDAEIIILHVFENLPSSARAILDTYLTNEQREKLSHRKPETIEKIRKRLNVFCEKVQTDDPTCTYRVQDIHISEGFPAEVILEKAEEFDCDIIVMGTHGKGIISHAFLGSVAEKVVRRSKKPVLIIPLPKGEMDLTVHNI